MDEAVVASTLRIEASCFVPSAELSSCPSEKPAHVGNGFQQSVLRSEAPCFVLRSEAPCFEPAVAAPACPTEGWASHCALLWGLSSAGDMNAQQLQRPERPCSYSSEVIDMLGDGWRQRVDACEDPATDVTCVFQDIDGSQSTDTTLEWPMDDNSSFSGSCGEWRDASAMAEISA